MALNEVEFLRAHLEGPELEKFDALLSARLKSTPLWPEPFCHDTGEAAWEFVKILQTWDESGKRVAFFPDLPYLQFMASEWVEHKHAGKPLVVFKCRRMVASWLFRGLELWSMGLRREDHVIVGLKREAAAKHVWRIQHFYDNLRERFPGWKLADISKDVQRERGARAIASIILPNQSQCILLNQEGQQFPGDGYSVVSCEELSRYDDVAETWAQANIVTEASPGITKGFVVGITNASPNKDWQELRKPDPGEPTIELCPGLKKSPLVHGGTMLELDLWADPGKDKTYMDGLERSLPRRQFRSEYLRDESIHEGEPIYPEFNDVIHNPKLFRNQLINWNEDHRCLIPFRSAEYYGGWDIGTSLMPAFALAQVVDGVIFWTLEVVPDQPTSLPNFVPRVLRALQQYLPGHWTEVVHYGDPAGHARSSLESDLLTAYEVASKHGIDILPAYSNSSEARRFATHALLQQWKKQEGDDRSLWTPRMVYSEKGCPTLVAAMQGGFKVLISKTGESSGGGMIVSSPVKNFYSHIAEAHEYVNMELARVIQKDNVRKRSYADS